MRVCSLQASGGLGGMLCAGCGHVRLCLPHQNSSECVCACVCVHVCMRVRVCVCVCTNTPICQYQYIHTFIHLYQYIQMSIHQYTHKPIPIHSDVHTPIHPPSLLRLPSEIWSCTGPLGTNGPKKKRILTRLSTHRPRLSLCHLPDTHTSIYPLHPVPEGVRGL